MTDSQLDCSLHVSLSSDSINTRSYMTFLMCKYALTTNAVRVHPIVQWDGMDSEDRWDTWVRLSTLSHGTVGWDGMDRV